MNNKNKKSALAIILMASLFATNCMPALAIIKGSVNKKPPIKAQTSQYKYNNVNVDWWKNYNDEILEGYIVKAVNENQDLKVATLKVEEARQQVKLQFSKELPTLTTGIAPAVYKMPATTVGTSTFGIPILVNYEADIFLKNHDKTKSAKKTYEVSKIQERAAYLSVASQVGATYFNIVRFDKLIAIQNDIIKSRKQIFELMKQRNQEGITSTADMIRAEKGYVMAVTDLSDLKKSRAVLLNSLAVLTGDSPANVEELKRVSYENLYYKKALPEEISSEVITQRPDYLAAEKQVEKAGIDVRVAKKDFLPSINIMGLAFFSATSAANSMSWENAIAALGGGALLPLFTGGAKVASLKLQKNKYEQILQNYYKTNLTAIQEVNDSLTSLKLDNDKYQKNLKTLKMQKADFNYTQARYNQGVISNLDLLQQKENLLVTEKIVVSGKTECLIDQISLYKAVGGKL